MASQDLEHLPENRRKRINRLKKMIIAVIIAAIVIPVIVCIVLAVCLHNTKVSLHETRQQLEEMQKYLESSQDNKAIENADVEGHDADSKASDSFGNSLINSDTALTSTGNENANSSQDAETVDGKKRVYLTFDDGPSNNTEEILDILNKYDVKATFFVVGNTSEHGQEVLKRIVSEGHRVGLHSYSHKYASIYDSEDAFFDDFNQISDYVYETTGVRSNICRLPGGSSNTVSRIDMADLVRKLNDKGIECYDWNIAGGDASGQKLTAEEIASNVLNGIERFQTAMVLLHDGADKDNTVEALDIILENLTARDDIVIDRITEDTPVILHISL